MRSKIIWIMLLLVLAPLTVTATAADTVETEAQTILQQYFTALKSGDVLSMKSLLCGELLNKRMILLNNPTYPQYLKDTFQEATLTIVQSRIISPNEVSTIAKFEFNGAQTLYKKFQLVRQNINTANQFRIQSESALSGPY